MESTNEVVIVSAYGRGNWLASELATHGWKVALVETTKALGAKAPEDWEGPFGVFHSDHLRPSQLDRLQEDDNLTPVPQGFTLWLPEGPLELRGSLSQTLLQKRGIDPEVTDYLLRYNLQQPSNTAADRRDLKKAGYEPSWLAHFAHQFGSNVFRDNASGLDFGSPLRLFSQLSLRRVTEPGFAKGLKAVRDRGVDIYTNAKIKDIGFNGDVVEALEVASERSGVLRGRLFVWMLSSEETLRFPNHVHEMLFPKGAAKAEWAWMRFRFEMNAGVESEVLPLNVALIRDLNLPWTHANLLVLQRSEGSTKLDVWARLPTQHRFQQSYVERIASEIEQTLARRMPGAGPKVIEMPLEHRLPPEEAGAPCFPVFAENDLRSLVTLRTHNLFFDGPEQWPTLDWVGQMVHQAHVLSQLEQIKAAWEAAKAKGAQA